MPQMYHPTENKNPTLYLRLNDEDGDVNIELVDDHGEAHGIIAYFNEQGHPVRCLIDPSDLRAAGLTPYTPDHNETTTYVYLNDEQP